MNNRAMFIGLRFVTNTASGMGLIKCGSVVIPFDNQISKDTDLYRLYNGEDAALVAFNHFS